MQSHSIFNGFSYVKRGLQIIIQPGLKRFVIMPLLVNIILISSLFYWLFNQFGAWMATLMSWIPSWLQWLDYLLWPLGILLIIFVFGYFFSTLANFIAAPFNGLLAERVEVLLTGQPLADMSYWTMVKDIPRVMKKECRKLMYYLPRALILFALTFIPVIGQFMGPVAWFIFGAWMMSVQYCDYPFDNYKIAFRDVLITLKRDRFQCIQFGAIIYLFTLIPLINLVIMPVAVCGATAMWVDRYRHSFIDQTKNTA